MDPRLYYMQGKTELVTTTVGLLTEFYTEKLAATIAHQTHAQAVTQYDANNTYQYIVNRDEVQLTWLAKAIADEGGSVPESVAGRDTLTSSAKRGDVRSLFDSDSKESQAFIERWRDKVEDMEHARHKAMLRVILGETREQQRFFEQALAGRTDLLGRRGTAAGPAQGEVLPARWIE
jgi:hypothetical protein